MARYVKGGDVARVPQINSELEAIETAQKDFLTRSGETPNEMLNSLDMNSNEILNLPAPATMNSPLRLRDVTGGVYSVVVEPITETVPVTDGEQLVQFTNVITGGTFHLNTPSGDSRQLSAEDIISTTSTSITLTDSVQEGSSVTLRKNGVEGEPVEPVKGLQELMFQREKHLNIGFRNDTYDELLSTYSYDVLYPQSFAVDKAQNEVFILKGSSSGDNSWGWVFVHDLTSGAFKTAFTTGEQWREGIVILYVGGVRYLYTIADVSVVRYVMDSLPSNKATVTPESTYNVTAFSFLACDGENFYVQDGVRSRSLSSRLRYKIYDLNFTPRKGTLVLPLDSIGTINDYLSLFPKAQGLTFHNGALYFGVGGAYDQDNPIHVQDQENPVYLQGLHAFTTTGEKLGTALSSPEQHLINMSTLSGYDNVICENEGLSSSLGTLYGLWITQGQSDADSDNDRGIVITKELSNSTNSVDFSTGQTGTRAAFNVQDFMNECHHSSSTLRNPATDDAITSFQEIIDMMNQLDISLYSFSGTNQVITDVNDNAVAVTGNLVRVTNINGFSFLFEVIGTGTFKQYYISDAGASQVIKDITFT